MSITRFSDLLHLCAMTVQDQQRWVEDFATLELKFIFDELNQAEPDVLQAEPSAFRELDWSAPAILHDAGISPDWLQRLNIPGQVYLHPKIVIAGDWVDVRFYTSRACLSDKQSGLLFPLLSRSRRPRTAGGRNIVAEDFLYEVRRLNRMIRAVVLAGGSPAKLNEYRRHITTHGRIGNVIGAVGSAGAGLAVLDAIREVDPHCISDVHGCELPGDVVTPGQIYSHIYEHQGKCPTTVLLKNGRAIAFAANPDVAIFEKLQRPYRDAVEAQGEWGKVRADSARRENTLKLHAFGEVKTATDRQNLTERMGLASRETKTEVRNKRFLMMSLLPTEFTDEDIDKAYNRFSEVFNLYYAWGYEGARVRHPGHWAAFKKGLADWCGLGEWLRRA